MTTFTRYANPCNSTGRSGFWRNYTVKMGVAQLADQADCTPTNQDSVLRAIDDSTVEFNLAFASGAFIKFLAVDYVKVLPGHLLDAGVDLNDPRALLENNSGSGPFVLEDYQEGNYYYVDKNENYFKDGRPYVDRIEHFIITDTGTLQAQFEAGALDMANGGFTNLAPKQYFQMERATDGDFVAHPIAAGTNWGLMLNVKKPQFQDTRVRAAIKPDSVLDYLARVLTLVGISLPTFFAGVLVVLLLSRAFSWLPPLGYVELWEDPWTSIRQMFLPALVLGFYDMAFIARVTRSSMMEIIREDYMRTARAKGLAEQVVLIRHGLKNAVLPILTISGWQFDASSAAP